MQWTPTRRKARDGSLDSKREREEERKREREKEREEQRPRGRFATSRPADDDDTPFIAELNYLARLPQLRLMATCCPRARLSTAFYSLHLSLSRALFSSLSTEYVHSVSLLAKSELVGKSSREGRADPSRWALAKSDQCPGWVDATARAHTEKGSRLDAVNSRLMAGKWWGVWVAGWLGICAVVFTNVLRRSGVLR